MNSVINNEESANKLVLVIDNLLEEINPLPNYEIYCAMQLPYCPDHSFDMENEVEMRLAKILVDNIIETIVEFDFDFMVENGTVYVYNTKYLELNNNLLLHFMFSAFDSSELPIQYRRKTVMEKAAKLFKQLVIAQ